jgi:tetratricopeptide (TPR) repeat protein
MAEAERDGVKKAELLVRAARILEDSGNKDAAIERYKAALDANKDNAAASSAMRAIYAGRGDAHGAAELLLREIASTSGTISQAKLWAELGTVRKERLKEPKAAKSPADRVDTCRKRRRSARGPAGSGCAARRPRRRCACW